MLDLSYPFPRRSAPNVQQPVGGAEDFADAVPFVEETAPRLKLRLL